MKDMESLQKAETAYEDLQVCISTLNYLIVILKLKFSINLLNIQKELEKAKQQQEHVSTEKANLEKKLQEQQIKGDHSSELKSSYSDLEVSQLKNEIEVN